MTQGLPDHPLIPHSLSELRLDPYNPRLPEDVAGKSQSELLKYYYENGVLDELAQSFIDNGYFPNEPLIITREKREDGYVVLEGNRRLAALMILLARPEAEGLSFGDIAASAADRKRLSSLPCYEVLHRDEVDAFVGFRHIGGLKMWGPEAKARYIVHHVDRAAANGEVNPFLTVARRVGSNTPGIRGPYMALAILRYARDEYGINVYRITNERRFGVWQRALNSPDLRTFIEYPNALTYREVKAGLRTMPVT